ncbi:MAG: GNAT family N-acetyltransferase [Clostridium sp.]|uniref:GNAT family N-acetyltransferase n=1 Tax=Clostridium sp. TaxID=1506 RepID=UPI003EE454E2
MIIREYKSSDCRDVIELFHNTVHEVNRKDYTKKQLEVWATGNYDLEKWDESLRGNYSIVMICEDIIVGFGDIDTEGYLDRLYVHKDYIGKGIGSAICDELEKKCGKKITTHASITAKPFFEKRGYKVIKKQSVVREGISLTNFIMGKIN